jgi:2-keto-4-pentenoate hydratase/2-oxohepta-3-ene-1,7-dioic acid hydratase in catechol pathway
MKARNPVTPAQALCGAAFFCALLGLWNHSVAAERPIRKYVRFQKAQTVAYGLLEGQRVRQIDGTPFGAWKQTQKTFALSEVRLLVPTQPSKVLAVARNYQSHLGPATDIAAPKHPELFYKPPSCLAAYGENIVIPPGTTNVHFEGEMVVVIGRRAKNVPPSRAADYVLGVTCGNDVSARDWQQNDIQWWRAKGSDTFGPCGPVIVSGLNHDDLLLQLRVNGQVRQQQRTRDLLQGVANLVSFASRHITLEPGDLIFTGTPGQTSVLKPGDVVEVELEGVGVLRNTVVARP